MRSSTAYSFDFFMLTLISSGILVYAVLRGKKQMPNYLNYSILRVKGLIFRNWVIRRFRNSHNLKITLISLKNQ